MDFNRQNIKVKSSISDAHVIDEGLRSYMLKVYNYMASGVFLTGIVSLLLFRLSESVRRLCAYARDFGEILLNLKLYDEMIAKKR